MSSRANNNPSLLLITVDGPISTLPPSLEVRATRGELALDPFDLIDASSLAANQVLRAALRRTKEGGGRLHLFGVVSDGGVHSSFSHLLALLDLAQAAGVRVIVHAFLDGIDAPAGSALGYVERLEARLVGGVGRIGTVSGRTWGMPPAGRWDRIEKLYRAITADNAERVDSATAGIEKACLFGLPEQLVAPFVVFDYPGVSLVDTALHFNFMASGARDLTVALAAKTFERFARKGGRAPFANRFVGMTPCDASVGCPTLFSRAPDLADLLVEPLSDAGMRALTCAEGSSDAIVARATEALSGGGSALVHADFASPNNASAGIGPELVTSAVNRLSEAASTAGARVVIVGSRGGSDRAPFAFLPGSENERIAAEGRVSDVVPTVLELLRLPPPKDAEGTSLLRP